MAKDQTYGGHVISVRLDDATWARLFDAALARRDTISGTIRDYIEAGLQRDFLRPFIESFCGADA